MFGRGGPVSTLLRAGLDDAQAARKRQTARDKNLQTISLWQAASGTHDVQPDVKLMSDESNAVEQGAR
jgi:hypothetical protein